VNKGLEPYFMPLAEKLLFRNFDLVVESTRIKRAQAALSFTVVCERAKVVIPDSQRRVMDDWLLKERSGPAQTVLCQVVRKFEMATT
jgi:proteasome component ECM29